MAKKNERKMKEKCVLSVGSYHQGGYYRRGTVAFVCCTMDSVSPIRTSHVFFMNLPK
jgi:hypothetical protein